MNEIPNRIDTLEQKMDLILEYLQEQRQQRQVVEDLVQDVSIVSRDAFKYAVDELDNQGILIDGDQVKLMIFRFLKNIENISNLLETLNSMSDLMKDAMPIVNEVIMDVTKKLAQLEDKGVFQSLGNISKNLANSDALKQLENISAALAQVKPDDKLDDKSLWKIYKDLKSQEVRSSISYLLRVVKTAKNIK
ncbi:MAG: hypothetical protein C0592_08295 [Marinilabiliales bacterium]|nr:MAG: hypothetical protein C0592_08295 [Marinilabiliales bacterium]